jgi:hypothetical protein
LQPKSIVEKSKSIQLLDQEALETSRGGMIHFVDNNERQYQMEAKKQIKQPQITNTKAIKQHVLTEHNELSVITE